MVEEMSRGRLDMVAMVYLLKNIGETWPGWGIMDLIFREKGGH